MENTKPERYSDITEQQIQDWKAKRGQHVLSELSVKVTDDLSARFVLSVPDQSAFIAISEQKEVTKVNKMLIANCVLGGDMQYLEKDAQVYAAVLVACTELLKTKPSTLKKL